MRYVLYGRNSKQVYGAVDAEDMLEAWEKLEKEDVMLEEYDLEEKWKPLKDLMHSSYRSPGYWFITSPDAAEFEFALIDMEHPHAGMSVDIARVHIALEEYLKHKDDK